MLGKQDQVGSGLRCAPTECSELFRSVDWSQTILGPANRWPVSLRTVVNLVFNTPQPMLVFWGRDLVQFYNDAYRPSLVGSGKHPRAMGQGARECWPEHWPAMQPQVEAVLQHGKSTFFRDQRAPMVRHGRIEETYWTYSFSPLYVEDGSIGGVLAVTTETTGQVRLTQELRTVRDQAEAARSELHQFMMQVPIGLALLSGPQHVFTFVNPQMRSFIFGGRPASDLINKSLLQAVPEIEGQGFNQLLDEVYRTGQPFSGSKLRASIVQGDGEEREMFVNFRYQARKDAQGRTDGVLVVVYEVTDQVNEQKEIESLASNLQRALIARDTFMGIASHELKTPLTSLSLQTETMQRMLNREGPGAMTRERLAKLLSNTRKQTERLDRLVSDMLDVSRITTGRLTLQRERSDVSRLAEEVVERFRPQLQSAGCDVTLQVQPDVMACVDPGRVEQVLANLITNAIRYAPYRPVHVALTAGPARFRVAVTDHGPGVAPEDQERIFQRFERARTGTVDVNGMGLGLYIARQIVEQHGGAVFLHSTPGHGAEFGFTLPLQPQPAQSPEPSAIAPFHERPSERRA